MTLEETTIIATGISSALLIPVQSHKPDSTNPSVDAFGLTDPCWYSVWLSRLFAVVDMSTVVWTLDPSDWARTEGDYVDSTATIVTIHDVLDKVHMPMIQVCVTSFIPIKAWE